MEWVEKTGRSVEEAKERALDQLGVSEKDAELVVLEEPKTGLFGRVRGEARVRARVRPAEPRPKRARRQRDRTRGVGRSGGERGSGSGTRPGRRGSGSNGSGDADRGARESTAGQPGGANGPGGTSAASRRRRRRRRSAGQGAGAEATNQTAGRTGESDDGSTADNGARRGRGQGTEEAAKEEGAVADGITLQEQAAVAKEFLEGLLDRYGLEATVDVRELDEETVELAANGEGLGLLVGPKGATVSALQDVTRTVVQKHFPNRTDRILVDVAGYRERRIAALRRFTSEVASEVLESGSERALEPMSAADRKVVHDTVLTIEGVGSSSQGEEPHRFVVISPTS
ncbi:MAG TPA: RNA-binding cell elongation regulator Jag/EloR [Acidimicrobiales bacterium]|nr:RNA-binding cell elongation regulator Jag/EloR [Acidimicrobiales bacterium]